MGARKQTTDGQKQRGQVRHSAGANVGNVPTVDVDESQRATLRKALYQAPGTTEHRGPTTRARARENRMDQAPKNSSVPHVVADSTSVRAERRAQEKRAAEKAAAGPSMDDLFAMLDKHVAAKKRGAPTKKMVDERPKVWQLGSWTNGDEACPDAMIEWRDA